MSGGGGKCRRGCGCKCESGTFKLSKMSGSGGNCRCDCGCCDCRCEIFTDLPPSPPRGPPLELLLPDLHPRRRTLRERKSESLLTIEAASGIPALALLGLGLTPFMSFGPAW